MMQWEAEIPEQYLVSTQHRKMEGLSTGFTGNTTRMRWVLGNKGIPGNK